MRSETPVPPGPVDSGVGPVGDQPSGAAGTVDDESTVGTGSAIALGCIGATLMLIVFGLVLAAAEKFGPHRPEP